MALLFLHANSFRILCLAQILCFLLLLPVTGKGQSSNEIVYVYDELGRLVGVIDTAGEAAAILRKSGYYMALLKLDQ